MTSNEDDIELLPAPRGMRLPGVRMVQVGRHGTCGGAVGYPSTAFLTRGEVACMACEWVWDVGVLPPAAHAWVAAYLAGGDRVPWPA